MKKVILLIDANTINVNNELEKLQIGGKVITDIKISSCPSGDFGLRNSVLIVYEE